MLAHLQSKATRRISNAVSIHLILRNEVLAEMLASGRLNVWFAGWRVVGRSCLPLEMRKVWSGRGIGGKKVPPQSSVCTRSTSLTWHTGDLSPVSPLSVVMDASPSMTWNPARSVIFALASVLSICFIMDWQPSLGVGWWLPKEAIAVHSKGKEWHARFCIARLLTWHYLAQCVTQPTMNPESSSLSQCLYCAGESHVCWWCWWWTHIFSTPKSGEEGHLWFSDRCPQHIQLGWLLWLQWSIPR